MAGPALVRASAPVCTATVAEIVVIGPAIWTVRMEGYALQIPPANVNKDFMVLVVIKSRVIKFSHLFYGDWSTIILFQNM